MKHYIENVFATPIFCGFIDNEIIQNSFNIAKKYMVKNSWDKRTFNGTTITTYYDDKNINYLGLVDDIQMLSTINNMSRYFLESLGIDESIDLQIESWLNLNLPLTSHYQHEHFGAILGGVIYLETDNLSGNLVIHDPVKLRMQANTYHAKKFKENNPLHIFSITPEIGKLIMFESWVTHSVGPNLSPNDRISIAFNIFEAK